VKNIIPTLALILLTGCVRLTWTPYVGEQQAWKTAPGSFVQTLDGMNIYMNVPNKPYKVLGNIIVTKGGHYSAVVEAKRHKADALIMIDSKTQYAGTVGGSTTQVWRAGNQVYANTFDNSEAVYRTTLIYTAINFLTDAEILLDQSRQVENWVALNPHGGISGTNHYDENQVSMMKSNILWIRSKVVTNSISK
jgi:hypothetical protein